MPTYAYRCTECGEALEVVQKFTDEPLTVCPACNGVLRKVFTPVGVVFKGSGFYKTDSRSSSTTKKAEPKPETKTTESTPSGDSSSTKSESPAKTEKKSPTTPSSDKVA